MNNPRQNLTGKLSTDKSPTSGTPLAPSLGKGAQSTAPSQQQDTPPAPSDIDSQMTETTRATQETVQRLRLSSISILGQLNSTDIDWIASRCDWISFDPGQLILNQDEQSNDVYFICSGSVKASIHSSVGHQVIYQTMAEGMMFGEIAAIDGAPRSVHIVADGSCLLAKLSATHFIELMRNNPDFSLAVTRQIIDTTRFLTARVFEFSALNVSQRIERELLRLANDFGQENDGEIVVESPPTHADIASSVNTHREAVTKHLNRLSRQGTIAKRGRTLIIRDINALKTDHLN